MLMMTLNVFEIHLQYSFLSGDIGRDFHVGGTPCVLEKKKRKRKKSGRHNPHEGRKGGS